MECGTHTKERKHICGATISTVHNQSHFFFFSGFPFCRLFHINVFAASNPFVGRVFRLLFYYVSVPNFLSLFLLVLLVSVGLPTFGIQCHACFCVIIQVALHCRVGTLYLSPFLFMRNKIWKGLMK